MTIKSVGVIGAGQMGNGIAHVFAAAGFDVLINDINPDGLGLSKLTAEQIEEARSSRVLYRVVPEPGSLLLVMAGSLLAFRRRS